jgi:nitroimidazol reductase NimA-like FMN-containing flavoprotein (pyridoxamine 5'-phosphate oxidase superfamily)
MASTLNASYARTDRRTLSRRECERTLARTCFGHLAFNRPEQMDMVPIRFAYVDGWVYFRAGSVLRAILARNPWMVLGVTELRDTAHFDSVIVRGGCYETEHTGSTETDAEAMRGILKLRDRTSVNRVRDEEEARTSTVYRLHVDDMQGVTTFVPCPAGDRPYDANQLRRLDDSSAAPSMVDDARADDDGMTHAE